MKKILCITLCLLALCSYTALAMDLSQGFLGYRWGEKITDDENFKLKHTGGIVEYYENTSQTYNISEVDSTYVVFGAIEGALYAVFVGIETEKGYVRAKDYLLSRLGNPKVKQQGDVLEYSWLKYNHTVRIKLKKDKKSGEMKMAIYYLPASGRGPAGVAEAFKELPSFSWQEKPEQPKNVPLLSF